MLVLRGVVLAMAGFVLCATMYGLFKFCRMSRAMRKQHPGQTVGIDFVTWRHNSRPFRAFVHDPSLFLASLAMEGLGRFLARRQHRREIAANR